MSIRNENVNKFKNFIRRIRNLPINTKKNFFKTAPQQFRNSGIRATLVAQELISTDKAHETLNLLENQNMLEMKTPIGPYMLVKNIKYNKNKNKFVIGPFHNKPPRGSNTVNIKNAVAYRKRLTKNPSPKIFNPKTGKYVSTKGRVGRELIKNNNLAILKTLVQSKSPKSVKNNMNEAYFKYGYKNVQNAVGNKRSMAQVKNLPRQQQNEMNKQQLKIRKKLQNITGDQVTLGSTPIQLGRGAAGYALKCLSREMCNRKWKDSVLKVAHFEDANKKKEWENEVKFHKLITKHMKDHPGAIPLAPKFYGSFEIGDYGYLLMQHANNVFPGAKRSMMWTNFGNNNQQIAVLPELRSALRRFRKAGFMHGDMHDGNLWIAEFVNSKTNKKTYKFFFTDFGRTQHYNASKTVPYGEYNMNWGYDLMDKSIRTKNHPNMTQLFMNNNNVYKQYYETYIKTVTNKKLISKARPNNKKTKKTGRK